MIKSPVNIGLLQSDIDFAGYKPLNADLSDYELGGGGGGGGALITINVQDAPYNAVGDGVADDTAAIQAAMNYIIASTNGGVLFFPNGVYLCNGAFDSTTNSILKIPFTDTSSTPTKTIVLMGQTPAVQYGPIYGTGAVIKTTRTDGSGYYPALLAANVSQGYPSDDITTGYFNGTMVYLRNLGFVTPADPTMSAVRLDTAAFAVVEDVAIIANGSSEPTHDVTGLWMPVGGNSGRSYARNVFIQGFRIGLMVSEHFVGHNVVVVTCMYGLGLTTGYQPAEVNFQTYWCPTHIGQFGMHLPVKIIGRLEDGDPRVAPAWQLVTAHVADSGNTISGHMDYIRVREPERFHDDIILTGAANLQLRNLHSSSYHWLKIGTDARLVPVSGGVKLEARNTGTGTWLEAARWTNP